jgi:hypothetical protein
MEGPVPAILMQQICPVVHIVGGLVLSQGTSALAVRAP